MLSIVLDTREVKIKKYGFCPQRIQNVNITDNRFVI